jgi:tRNA(fMet)-specific endonuclease VapC
MSLLMLDTSIASAIISQRVDPAAQFGELDQADWCISAITRAELQFGIRRKPAATCLARLVAAFLAAARAEPFDGRAADECRRVRAELERLGIGIGVADELIAAHALSLGAAVVTVNLRQFERIAGLEVRNWPR